MWRLDCDTCNASSYTTNSASVSPLHCWLAVVSKIAISRNSLLSLELDSIGRSIHYIVGSFPYNGEAPLGHGSTKCVSPSQNLEAPVYGHGSTRCLRPSYGRAHLTGTAAMSVSLS